MVDYIIYYGKASLSSPWAKLAKSTGGLTDVRTSDVSSQKLLPSTNYKFMVQPFNTYGAGYNSTVIYAATEEGNGIFTSLPILIAGLISGLASLCA